MRPACLVSDRYTPDSYNRWVPKSIAPETAELDTQSPGPCRVYIRWVLDSDRYNEWMNPIDYEVEADDGKEAGAAQPATGDPLHI